MKRLGIAMIGYGGIGRVHALAYRDLAFLYGLPAANIDIVGVATSRAETARQAAAEIGCPLWTTDYRELLARTDVDLIDCCTPNHTHAEIVIAAAQAGKHVYCEKPLAMTVAEGQRMAAAVAQAGINSQMTFHNRFFPAMLRARQLVDEGFLGRVFSFRGRYYRPNYINPQRPLTWRLCKEIFGGGALFDLGSHVLDLIQYLLGNFSAVQATLETLIRERPLAAGASEMGLVDVDDMALLHLRMADDTLGLVEVSRMGTGTTNDLELEIFGEQGAIRFSAAEPSWLEIYNVRDANKPIGGLRGFRKVETVQHYVGQKAPDWTMTPTFVRAHAECQYQFLKAIAEDRPATPDLAAGLHVQEVMEAAQRSLAEGRWVKIEEVR